MILHAGVVVGSDGFGYVFDGREQVKFPQAGQVALDDDVEIGANTTIDRGSLGTTRIGRGTKVDNLVQIAHNVEIGEGRRRRGADRDLGQHDDRGPRGDRRAGGVRGPRPGRGRGHHRLEGRGPPRQDRPRRAGVLGRADPSTGRVQEAERALRPAAEDEGRARPTPDRGGRSRGRAAARGKTSDQEACDDIAEPGFPSPSWRGWRSGGSSSRPSPRDAISSTERTSTGGPTSGRGGSTSRTA